MNQEQLKFILKRARSATIEEWLVPNFTNTFSWGQKIDKGIDTLTYNVKYGLNAMPAMGLCAIALMKS